MKRKKNNVELSRSGDTNCNIIKIRNNITFLSKNNKNCKCKPNAPTNNNNYNKSLQRSLHRRQELRKNYKNKNPLPDTDVLQILCHVLLKKISRLKLKKDSDFDLNRDFLHLSCYDKEPREKDDPVEEESADVEPDFIKRMSKIRISPKAVEDQSTNKSNVNDSCDIQNIESAVLSMKI